MTNRRILRGIELRYVLTMTLARDGKSSIPDLLETLAGAIGRMARRPLAWADDENGRQGCDLLGARRVGVQAETGFCWRNSVVSGPWCRQVNG